MRTFAECIGWAVIVLGFLYGMYLMCFYLLFGRTHKVDSETASKIREAIEEEKRTDAGRTK